MFGDPYFGYVLKEGLNSLFNNEIAQDDNLSIHLIFILLSVLQKLSLPLSIIRFSQRNLYFQGEAMAVPATEGPGCFFSVPFISHDIL